MAGKYFLTVLAQFGPVLLQALLNRSIIAQLLSAKALRISSAGLLLLWRSLVILCKRQRSLGQQNDEGEDNRAHNDLPVLTGTKRSSPSPVPR